MLLACFRVICFLAFIEVILIQVVLSNVFLLYHNYPNYLSLCRLDNYKTDKNDVTIENHLR